MNYSEEEKKAIEYINRQRQGIPPNGRFIINNTDIQIILNLIETQKAEIKKKNKAMNLMAEQLTSPINNKKWVIEYYERLAEEEK